MTKNWCLVVLVTAGCVVEEVERASVGSGGAELVTCDPLNCPGNSDLIALLGPYELDKTGVQYSRSGFRIIGVSYKGQPATALDIIGTTPQVTVGGAVVKADSLVGLRLTLHHLPSNRTYPLEVRGHTRVPYYVDRGDPFPGYHIKYLDLDPAVKAWKELCPYAQHVDHGIAGSWAVLWKGDRYHPITGAILASDTAASSGVGPWFNISCAGEATIKMLRARTGGAYDPSTPVSQRQATLNMFAAAYCGPTGQRYTQLGQSIAWSDLSGPSQIGSVSSYEAVWQASGATCLGVPRFADPGEIACADQLPPCPVDVAASWQQSGWLLSGNPAGAP